MVKKRNENRKPRIVTIDRLGEEATLLAVDSEQEAGASEGAVTLEGLRRAANKVRDEPTEPHGGGIAEPTIE